MTTSLVICAVCKKNSEHEKSSWIGVYGTDVPENAYYRVCQKCSFQDAPEQAWVSGGETND